MRFTPVFFSLALASVATLSCPAQYVVKQLSFPGAEAYPQSQLEAVAGLKPGQHIGTKELTAASQRLVDTGAFADIDATVSGPVAGCKVIFKLKPLPQDALLPVSFDNFVWFTPEERDAELRKRVPLYTGKLPQAGNLQESVQKALQEMVTAAGVNGKVEYAQLPTTESRSVIAVGYRVNGPTIQLSNVKLQGVSAEMSTAETAALKKLVGLPYDEGIDFHLNDLLLAAYRNAGYMDAKIEDFKREPSTAADGVIHVVVSGRVAPGDVYRVGALTWTGTPVYSADEFVKNEKLHPGDLASAKQLEASYRPLLDAYLHLGYVDAVIVPQAKADAGTHTVSYTLQVNPGEVYHVGSVSANGLDAKAQQDFTTYWRMKAGSVYDPVYAQQFIEMNSSVKSLQPYMAKFTTTSHPETHTSDVVMNFYKNTQAR